MALIKYLLICVCVCQPYRVRGCILTLVERMDEEFTKIMQNTDPHSQGEVIFHFEYFNFRYEIIVCSCIICSSSSLSFPLLLQNMSTI